MFYAASSALMCTGTLIGCKTVLTAGHCFFSMTRKNGQQVVGSKPVSMKFELAGVSYDVDVAQSHAHPSYDSDNNGVLYNDLSVLRLVQAPPIKPLPIALISPTLNQELTLIGFGAGSLDGTQPTGTKRVGVRTDYDLGPANDQSRIGFRGVADKPNLCHGDSGGPTLAMINGVQSVVGVHSYIQAFSPSALCTTTLGQDMRVERHAQGFIIPAGNNDVATSAQPNLTCAVTPQQPPQNPNNPNGDNTPPTITITSPTDGAKLSSGQVSVFH